MVQDFFAGFLAAVMGLYVLMRSLVLKLTVASASVALTQVASFGDDGCGCGVDCELKIDGIRVNRCRLEASCEGRIGFQTKSYPQGKAPIFYRNMVLTPMKSTK